ncbi:LysR family transcriptional regulator [Shimazuella sp. AN120528]|uniref:LysR family transcriptional regulator n=1 Tax=Shimazuella soli TaxID=1892854 RepID=UPI001F0DD6B6|nr:LysR family transcriptional regulator [Shimazuella soli]MCH5584321.1 LysR family transcriptional regulator [Shimazuella soli]
MELRQIQYFIEVAEREHMTDAALALHVAQSAVSRQIANLEAELGVQLFIREGRNIRITPIGKIFLHHAKSAVRALANAKQEMDEFLDPEKGTIRIGFPSSLAAHTLPTVISAFRDQHPHIGFQLRQGSYLHLIDAVNKGEIDLAFLGPIPTDEKQIEGKILFLEKIVALLPMDHPMSNAASIHLDDLRNDSFVLFPTGFILRDIVINACTKVGFSPNISFEGEDIDAIKGLVATGLGVTLLPEVTLIDNVPRGTAKVPIHVPNLTRNVGIVIPKNRQLPPSEQLFYDFVTNFFSRLNEFNS